MAYWGGQQGWDGGYQQGGYQQGGYDQGGYYQQGGYQQGGYDPGYQQQRGYNDGGYMQQPNPGYQHNQPQGGWNQGPSQQSYQGPEGWGQQPYQNPQTRKKSLLIGINYAGTKQALQGCQQDVENIRHFLGSMGYPSDQNSQVIMRDDRFTDPRGPFYPNGANILAAMDWLISEPGTNNFLHYSGHGGQVADQSGTRRSGVQDTIVPRDFEQNGQIPSGFLHRHLVSRLPPSSTLFVIFDCCHSGSTLELPYVYRADENGNVSMMDNVKTGIALMASANNLIQGGFAFTPDKLSEAKSLLAGATSFFRGLTHKEENDEWGLGANKFDPETDSEGIRNVWMYSGCRDDQTSADANIAGARVGAMSWAFLECMRRYGPNQSWIQVLQNTRIILKDRYTQVPQLSVGYQQDLNWPIKI